MTDLKMKAIAITGYGSPQVLQVREFAQPQPQADEILVQIRATPVTAADTLMRRGVPRFARLFLGWRRPKQVIPGTCFAGVVSATGRDVRRFRVGDAVFGLTTLHFSANAEYVCVPEDGVVVEKPTNLSFAEAATAGDGALTSLNFLRELAQVRPGQKVLINGASGSLGTAAVQLAKHLGAEVTGVCSTRNVALVQSLGADAVIDYTEVDFTKTRSTYDVIFDTIGKSSFARCQEALRPKGQYLSPVLRLPLLLRMLWTRWWGAKRARFAATGLLPEPQLRAMLHDLKGLYESGQLRAVIDQRYPLGAVVEAHRYVDTGRKRGNVVLLPAS
ncbi:MAG: NAD(P)-dependent alcohol dehydrogenase [Bacteroidota bacterium]